MQRIIISDTSCLVILSKINKLNILNNLFGNVIITQEVADEFGESLPDWIDIMNAKDKVSQTLIGSSIEVSW